MLLASLNALAGILSRSPPPRVQPLVRTARHRTYRATSPSPPTILPTPPPLSNLATSTDAAAARDWLTRFRECQIPRTAVDIAFSRSPGPGGQNVNKVNTKATVRCALDSTWIPSWARDGIRKSPFFVKSSCSILLTSTVHRSQAQNVDDCLSKLHGLICSASSQAMPSNDPSEEQRERVRVFERRADAQRRLQKDKRSQTKQHRANRRLDWD